MINEIHPWRGDEPSVAVSELEGDRAALSELERDEQPTALSELEGADTGCGGGLTGDGTRCEAWQGDTACYPIRVGSMLPRPVGHKYKPPPAGEQMQLKFCSLHSRSPVSPITESPRKPLTRQIAL